VNAGRVPGLFDGVLHLGDDVGEMRRLLATQGWPPRYVQVLDAADAAARAAVPLTRPAWFFPDAGWVAPAALVRCMLDAAGASMRLHLRAPVAQLRRQGERWRAVGEEDRVLAEADIVVLANAAGVAQLAPAAGAAACRLGQSRGQVTRLSAGQFAAALPSVPRPRLPMARNGYVIALPDGGMLCGATNHSGDDGTTAPRVADHHHNLQVLARLLECPVPDVLATDSGLAALEGRVGWRCHADDRLPLIGPLAAAAPAPGAAPTQPRHVAREGGLFAITALGARGLTGAMLGARTLAALVCDAPLPIDTDLLDAVDAARHTARAARRRTGGHGGAQ
jgi:tRNA 5-methylaminomethyl-2-thiouridine biosynthesis bifunctional protein